MAARHHKQIRLKCIVLGAANAGKTSILRRYFLGTFQSSRVPTVGADFYTCRVKYPVDTPEEKKDTEEEISLQMWDTAGRKRFVAKEQTKISSDMSDAFFRQANAAMLVYDATSSTSFTQLLQWHSDLMEKLKHLGRSTPFPVLIVANKMDLFKKKDYAKPERRKVVQQRHVMGFDDFKGRHSRYEYRVSRDHGQTIPNKRREEISTYMVTGNTWTNDCSYLDSVLNTEDRSHPDRDMVLLWCMRNGLKHVEVSALDGTGVNAAMEALVELAMRQQIPKSIGKIEPATGYHEWSNEELDLHKRYAPTENKFRCWRPWSCCRK